MSVFKRGLEEYKSVSRCLPDLFFALGWGLYIGSLAFSRRPQPTLTWKRLQQIELASDQREEAGPSNQHRIG